MNFMDEIKEKAKLNIKKIIFPEAEDERVLKAAALLKKEKIVEPVLLGKREKIISRGNELGLDLSVVEIIEPKEDFGKEYYKMRKHKGITLNEAREMMKDPVFYATMLLYLGAVDGLVSGAKHATGDTFRPALQIIKTKPKVRIASSIFFMILNEKVYIFSDCSFVVDPDAEELAEIALSAAESARFFGLKPKVALLSFSTKGSANHPRVEKVRKAVEILESKKPNFVFDGEMQLDAAIVPDICKQKCPNCKLHGDANVLIFPDLDAGNMGYKLVQRLAGAEAIGPIVQGLNKPVNDVSRGCSVQDIVNVAAITSIQANGK